jgi:hypothetical protein
MNTQNTQNTQNTTNVTNFLAQHKKRKLTDEFETNVKKAKLSEHSVGEKIVKLEKDGALLYFGHIKRDEKLYSLVMELVTDQNLSLWKNYINKMANPRIIGIMDGLRRDKAGGKNVGTVSDGMIHFKSVLDDVDHHKNEIFVCYFTNELNPKPIPMSMGLYDPAFQQYDKFSDGIMMMVTVVSSPNALITSHMGIAETLEGILKHKRPRGISVDLHSFGAKVMLLMNPKRKFMINAPVWAMEKIMAQHFKNSPESLHIGTKEMFKHLSNVVDIPMNVFLSEHKEKFLQERPYLKNPKRKTTENDLYGMFKDPYPTMLTMSGSSKVLYVFMKKFQPIISLGSTDKFITSEMQVFEYPSDTKPWLTIRETDSTYDFMFQSPFKPAGLTHYMAVNLKDLANAGILE